MNETEKTEDLIWADSRPSVGDAVRDAEDKLQALKDLLPEIRAHRARLQAAIDLPLSFFL